MYTIYTTLIHNIKTITIYRIYTVLYTVNLFTVFIRKSSQVESVDAAVWRWVMLSDAIFTKLYTIYTIYSIYTNIYNLQVLFCLSP
jgi:hypothetical protein